MSEKLRNAGLRIEKRVARALERGMARFRAELPVSLVEDLMAADNLASLSARVDQTDLEDFLSPATDILKDAVTTGGKITAEEL